MNVIPEKIVKMLRCLGTKKDANAKIISMTVNADANYSQIRKNASAISSNLHIYVI
jgi:hypothetical protein